MSIIEVKSGSNLTCQNGNSMKQVHMGNNESLVSLRGSISYSTCMKVYPYSVDGAYFALIQVECLLLMNIIFLMGGMFNAEHT